MRNCDAGCNGRCSTKHVRRKKNIHKFVEQATISFPTLKTHIWQCVDMGDTEQLLELLLSCEGVTV
jgi:hypothetical protein